MPDQDLTDIRRAAALLRMTDEHPLFTPMLGVFEAEIDARTNMDAVAWASSKALTFAGGPSGATFQVGADKDGDPVMVVSTTAPVAVLARAIIERFQ